MTVTDSIPKKRLKIKFSSTKIDTCELSQKLWMNDEHGHSISINGKKSYNFVQGSSKREPPAIIDFQKEKRQKMDRSVKQQCGSILKALLDHPVSLGFREPVDPVKLNIPDYFSIITKPMDLGTIRTKLEDNAYFSVEEFAADVRLTFSNAMTYNPPFNHFHKMAKKLEIMFNSKWKSLEAKWDRETVNFEQNFTRSNTQFTREICSRKSPVRVISLPKTHMSNEEKRKLRKELLEAMRTNMTEKLRMFLEQLGLIFRKGEKPEIEIDGFDDATLRELQKVVKCSLDARAAKAETAKITQKVNSLGNGFHKGLVGGIKSTSGTAKTITSLTAVAPKCHQCGSVRCQCSLIKDCAAAEMCHEVKSMLTSNTSKSDPKLDGAVNVLDKENKCSTSPQLSTLPTTAISADGWTAGIDIQLSPKRALRAAMLKSRFAGVIVKAKQKTLANDDKVDPVKLQQERERLERQQQQEKARLEAQIKADEIASTLRAHEEMRTQREREREAARLALQKMEKTVEIDENVKILEELEMFSRSFSSNNFFQGSDTSGASEGGHFGSPLERLGLFIKDDDFMEDEDDEVILNGDGEEGEIFL